MKIKLIFNIVIFFVLTSCINAQNNLVPYDLQKGNKIKITVKYLKDKQVSLGYHFTNKRYVLDTLVLDNNYTVLIDRKEALPKGVYFLYSQNLYFEFIISENEFTLSTDTVDYYKNLKVEKSVENELFKKFQLAMLEFNKRESEITEKLNKNSTKDDSTKIKEELTAINKEVEDYRKKHIEENPNSYFIAFLKIIQGPEIKEFEEIEKQEDRDKAKLQYYKDHYFDIAPDISSLMRTPVIYSYIMKYFDNVVLPNGDSTILATEMFLDKIRNDDAVFRYWVINLYNKFITSKYMGHEAVAIHLAEKYISPKGTEWLDEETLKKIREEVYFVKPNLVGQIAPQLTAFDANSKPFTLDQIKEDYVFLFFYDPDCGHCKKKLPQLGEIYPKLKELNGQIVTICIITDEEKWKSSIKTHKMEQWINVADLKGQSNFRALYNTRSTPQIYILNKKRKIVAKKIDIEQIIPFVENYRKYHAKKD